MKSVHIQEKAQFKTLFQQEGVDRFEDRFKILEVFLQNEQHLTASILKEKLEKTGLSYDLDFVRDTLKMMCHFGFAQQILFENGQARYEHRHLGQHHDHMVCTKCGKIVEFAHEALEALQAQVVAEAGFHMLQHKLEIYGICHECLKLQVRMATLDMAKPGERLVIQDFKGGAQARMRLLTMGLKLGDQIEVITNQGSGQVVVAANFHRYALGRGLAQKILVGPSEETR